MEQRRSQLQYIEQKKIFRKPIGNKETLQTKYRCSKKLEQALRNLVQDKGSAYSGIDVAYEKVETG